MNYGDAMQALSLPRHIRQHTSLGGEMPDRFAFRQIDRRDLAMILSDGEVRSKEHAVPQHCHQTSYAQIVGFRGTPAFNLPYGGVANNYVPFYFSPVTAFSLVIHRRGVEVKDPAGNFLGMSSADDRLFLVSKVADIYQARLGTCFSDYALNSLAPMPTIIADFNLLESHVKWPLFDEAPIRAKIPEVGYNGVCQYFFDTSIPPARQNRKSARMAELLVKDAVSTHLLCCILAPNETVRQQADSLARKYGFRGLVLNKPDCFVS